MLAYALGSILFPLVGSGLAFLLHERHARLVGRVSSFLAFVSGLAVLVGFALHRETGTWDLLAIDTLTVFGVTVDALSALVNFMVVLIGWLICLYSAGYMSERNQEHPIGEGIRRYYVLLLLFIASMSGLVFSSTLVGQLFFFEMTGLCSWALIGFYGDLKSRRSALWAIILTHVASVGLYVATAYVFLHTGSFSIDALGQLPDYGKIVVFLGLLIACWGKSAQVPFHPWLPRAMVAPTPVSAYLHAASMVKVGVYIFARSVMAAGAIPAVVGKVGLIMAVATMLYGFLMYFPQHDMKRMLAYSTIAQLGYIFMAISLAIYGSRTALLGGVAHIFNHSFAKALFFLVAGTLAYTTGTRQLPVLTGILRKMPLVGLSYLAAVLAITGVPPFSGFFSKFVIFWSGLEVGVHDGLVLLLVILALIESVGSFIWMLRWATVNVLGEPSETVAAAITPTASMHFVLALLIVMTLISQYVAFGLFQ
ncbi:MAG TPA: hydrogenase 4 subunit D [Thermaerobacter sp.]